MSDDNTLSTLAIAAGAAGVGWWLYQRHAAKEQAVATLSEKVVRAATAPVLTALPVAGATGPASGSAAAAKRAPATGPTQPITREFDAIFAAHGHGLPVAYLRALAAHESDMHAGISDGPAIGLLQVIDAVRADHNALHGTTITRADLLVPATNVEVAARALRRIVDSYQRNHPAIANLREDWSNLRFAELVTLGWAAGWSERQVDRRLASGRWRRVVGRGLTARSGPDAGWRRAWATQHPMQEVLRPAHRRTGRWDGSPAPAPDPCRCWPGCPARRG